LKIFKLAAKPLKVLGKALPFVSAGLDIAMLGLAIDELVNHKARGEEWKKIVENANQGKASSTREKKNMQYFFLNVQYFKKCAIFQKMCNISRKMCKFFFKCMFFASRVDEA